MNKKDLIIAAISAFVIGLLTIPTINNLPLPEAFVALGTNNVALLLGALTMTGYVFAQILGKKISVFKQIGKFAVVGVLNTVLDFAVLNILISTTGISEGLYAVMFAGIAFITAVINSYYWNKYWTFQVEKKTRSEFLEFIGVSLIGFGLNVGAFHTIVNIIDPISGIAPGVWANLGALAGTIIGLIWNFLGYKFIVFKRRSS